MTLEVKRPLDSPKTLVPFENRTLWERVHEFLRDEIMTDRLPPGTELQEVALAEALGVSRGPVREALGRLSAEGLVTIRPRNGAVVRGLSKQEFIEAYQVREALETFALRLAVPRMAAEELRDLERLIDQMVQEAEEDDVLPFFQTNAAFHEALVEASGNSRLCEIHAQLARQLGRYRMRSLALRGNVQRSIAEHREILGAIRTGDAGRAVELLSVHIHVPLDRLESAAESELAELGLADPQEIKE
ncbi:MAG: GntR family transcriptional regulator [Chloroflexota bacterium]